MKLHRLRIYLIFLTICNLACGETSHVNNDQPEDPVERLFFDSPPSSTLPLDIASGTDQEKLNFLRENNVVALDARREVDAGLLGLKSAFERELGNLEESPYPKKAIQRWTQTALDALLVSDGHLESLEYFTQIYVKNEGIDIVLVTSALQKLESIGESEAVSQLAREMVQNLDRHLGSEFEKVHIKSNEVIKTMKDLREVLKSMTY